MPIQKTKLKFRSSWDDGHSLDFQLADILKKYNLPAIFYIPNNAEIAEDGVKILANNPLFELGGHTVSHPSDMKLLSDDQLKMEIAENKLWLEALIDKPVTKFCYPRGRYDDRTIKYLKLAGFTEARTTVVLQTKSKDPFRTNTAVHVYQRAEYADIDWFEVAHNMVAEAIKKNGIFHIWGHSWEIARDKNWQKLEMFFEWLTENYEIIS